MGVLLVAAGGGGDALAATIIHRILRPSAALPLVLTYAWERLRIDPLPGPRGPDGFTALVPVGRFNWQITPKTDTVPPGRSTLPRLAGQTDARLHLIDPSGGAGGIRRQVTELVEITGADRVWVVDVGGDVVARGDEPGLRSPLADGLALAACTGLPVPVEILTAGPGLDGELSESEVLSRVEALGGRILHRLHSDEVQPALDVLAWHPTEATALLIAAALGARGTVEIRDNGTPVELTDHSADIYGVDLAALVPSTRHVASLADTGTLAQAEDVIRRVCGISEIDYEREKAQRLSSPRFRHRRRFAEDLCRDADAHIAAARARGIDYLTFRRLAEALDVYPDDIAELQARLLAEQAERPALPLWPVRNCRYKEA
ncbi:DUF1152 domain-containing protein [Candidatus Protofrankia californiensis]|uniref:DUF1152 domain-containing protein n=1 Tax=Candidatus Protofrankia californiensis TaxID=1839754 RepID=UPI0013EA565A|nr:DUF1152 domain-containing protein [Candidatus Protofrankia californiensis]